ncbi:MAG: cell wall hydrolase [Eubacterium sp.]|nr:cell wall hydrolase [Eubacterium sp.]
MFTKKIIRVVCSLAIVMMLAMCVKTTDSSAAKRRYTTNDLKYMAAIIYCEAGIEPYAGKLAVGCVILNRVKSRSFPNKILSVIKQPHQFGPVSQGKFQRELKRIEKGMYSRGQRRKSLKAAQEVLEGQRNIKYAGKRVNFSRFHYFNGTLSCPKFKIAGHQFK